MCQTSFSVCFSCIVLLVFPGRLVIAKEPDRKFLVPKHIAIMSQTIGNLLEALPDLNEEVPISNITGDEFQKVLQKKWRDLI